MVKGHSPLGHYPLDIIPLGHYPSRTLPTCTLPPILGEYASRHYSPTMTLPTWTLPTQILFGNRNLIFNILYAFKMINNGQAFKLSSSTKSWEGDLSLRFQLHVKEDNVEFCFSGAFSSLYTVFIWTFTTPTGHMQHN